MVNNKAIIPKSNAIYLVGGGSKNLFWGNMIASLLNQKIFIGEDSALGPALGVARLAMLSTKEYNYLTRKIGLIPLSIAYFIGCLSL